MAEKSEIKDDNGEGSTEQRFESQAAGSNQTGTGQPAVNAPAGNQESIIDAIQRPKPQSYIQGIGAIMAVMGALLGVGVYLVAQFGGRSLLPGLVDQFSGTPGLQGMLDSTHQLTMAYMANELTIFLAFVMAPLFGTVVTAKLDDTKQAKMGAAGVGVAVGTIVFSFIVVFIASVVAPSASDFVNAAAELEGAAATPTGAEEQMIQGVELGSINIGNTVLNSVLIGIPAGVAAASIVYFDEKFFD